jgi:hypothetical protein
MSLSAPEDAFLDVNDAHLRVYGNVHADGLKLGQLEIVTTTSTGSTIQFLHQHTAFTTTSNIEVGTTNHDLFVDTKNSKVGVLTNTPTTALDVNGTVKATAFDGDGALLTGIPSSAINGTLSQWTTVTGPKIHYSDGNVGIGIADPLHTLDVVGDINFTGTLREDGNPFVSTPWTIESGPTALSYTLGNVGVGGTTPSAKLEVTGNAHVSTDLSVGGKIGVGVDSPDANLHVVGNCHVSTNMELGGTLVMGTVTVEAQHALSAITATGNTTPHTIEFQNAETSLVTTGNVVVGGDLDISGNLGSSLVNLVYPIGAVYISVNSADPGTIWAGTTWVAFGEGRTLVGQGQGSGLTNRPTVEATGGAETHTLTKAEIPPHKHTYLGNYYDGTTDHGLQYRDTNAFSAYRQSNDTTNGSADGLNGDAHNNMQPFIVTYMWKRTA